MDVLKHVSSEIAKLKPYEAGKPIELVADELGLSPEDIIKMASNESPIGPSKLALKAMKKAASQMHLYPDAGGTILKERIAQQFEVTPDEIVLGNGSNEILEFIGHTFMGPGKSVVVSQYAFIVYRLLGKLFGSEVIEVPTISKYGHDLDGILEAITEETSVVILCNPNNPTGTLVTQAAIDKFMKAVPTDVLVVFDEAYAEICLGNMPNTIQFVKENRNCVVLRTFSKAYGLAGLRVGFGLGPAPIIEALQKPRQPFNCNRMAQITAVAAMDDQAFVKKCVRIYKKGKKYLEGEFKKLELDYVPTSANFILVKTENGRRVFEELQKREMIIRSMDAYGLPSWIRVSIGTMEQNEIFIKKLREVICK
ncbi:MAG: histidinol-phosphate transaminase [Lentisphaeria bacterium]|nr:histidinol-phosphate transaminase [Lentisphaeria bacterium]